MISNKSVVHIQCREETGPVWILVAVKNLVVDG